MATNSNIYKGISFPFRFDSKGGVATSVLTPNDYSRISESIHQIIFTRKYERIMKPNFFTPAETFLFEPTDDETAIGEFIYDVTNALEEFEDRITVNDIHVHVTEEGGEEKINVLIDARIVKFMRDEIIAIEINR